MVQPAHAQRRDELMNRRGYQLRKQPRYKDYTVESSSFYDNFVEFSDYVVEKSRHHLPEITDVLQMILDHIYRFSDEESAAITTLNDKDGNIKRMLNMVMFQIAGDDYRLTGRKKTGRVVIVRVEGMDELETVEWFDNRHDLLYVEQVFMMLGTPQRDLP